MIPEQRETLSVGSVEMQTYKDGDNVVSVTLYRNENGLIVAFHDCFVSQFNSVNNGKAFNGLLLNVCILGSSYRSTDSYTGERMAGCGNITVPWTGSTKMESSNRHVVSLNVVVLMNDFKLSRFGDRTDMVIQSLVDRYSKGNIQFVMSDLSMVYCYALFRLLFECNSGDDELIVRLVSWLLMDLYCNEQKRIVSEPHEDHTIADSIFADLLSRPMVIDRDCLEEIYSKYGVSKYKAIRLFRDRYGETPYSYFKRTRLQMAASLILTGDTNMMNVASRVGYASESKFAIAFKKQFGVRPKHFLAHIQESYDNLEIR